jgi:hypothetical protein
MREKTDLEDGVKPDLLFKPPTANIEFKLRLWKWKLIAQVYRAIHATTVTFNYYLKWCWKKGLEMMFTLVYRDGVHFSVVR